MFVFPFWTPLITPEHHDRKAVQHDDLITEHLISLRDHYVPGQSHYWR